MKLDRNSNKGGGGKYGLVRMRKVRALPLRNQEMALGHIAALRDLGVWIAGDVGDEDEFFVVMLKDRHAHEALAAYATSVAPYDKEYADEIDSLAARAGDFSPWCKAPD